MKSRFCQADRKKTTTQFEENNTTLGTRSSQHEIENMGCQRFVDTIGGSPKPQVHDIVSVVSHERSTIWTAYAEHGLAPS